MANSTPGSLDVELDLSPDAEEQHQATAFLRWAGGKGRLLDKLLPHIPARFERYHEPFVGGGAVFFAVRHRARGTCFLSDLNDELINAWIAVRDHGPRLLKAIERYYGCDTEEAYYEIRESEWPKDKIERAARFLYLNQTAWNCLWRVNRWGKFNVPWGARPFRGMTPEQMERASASIRGVSIRCLDFRKALSRAKAGDFVYLDPPYLPISDTSKFAKYTKRRFRCDDLAELAEICSELSAQGVHWLLSNRDTPLVRELFSFAEIHAFTARRAVAAQNRRHVEARNSPEVVVIGRPE